jgi:predicted DNA-binding ribbon-helix-helix protein
MGIRKYTMKVGGLVTSVSAEEEFWLCLKEISVEKETTVTALVNEIDSKRQHPNLSSALRVFVISHYIERSKLIG